MKTRELKSHYRNVERKLRDFTLNLSDESWYDLWHLHLDWDGITKSEEHRRRHFMYYLKFLDKIETLTTNYKKEFQAFIHIDGKEGFSDAIYFHTPNPHGEFPLRLDDIEWNVEIPFLVNMSDIPQYNIGRFKDEDKYAYIIQKKGLGLEIN